MVWIHSRGPCLLLLLSISQMDVKTPQRRRNGTSTPGYRRTDLMWVGARKQRKSSERVQRDPKHIVVIPMTSTCTICLWPIEPVPVDSLDLDVSSICKESHGITIHIHVSKCRSLKILCSPETVASHLLVKSTLSLIFAKFPHRQFWILNIQF